MPKRIIKIVSIVSLIVILTIAFLPSLLSISHVNKLLLSGVNRYIAGNIQYEELSLGWMKGASLRDVVVRDPYGQQVAKIKKVSLDAPLYQLLSFPNVTAKVEIESPAVELIPEKESGHFSIEHVVTAEPDGALKSKEPEIIISDLHCLIDLKGDRTAKVELDCLIDSKDSKKQGRVHIDAEAKNITELKEAYTAALTQQEVKTTPAAVELQCKIEAFPMSVAQTFMSIVDPLKAALIIPAFGSSLDADIQHTFKDERIFLNINAKTPKLRLQTSLKAKKSEIEIQEPLLFSWQISPHLAAIEESATLNVMLPKQKGTLGPKGSMPLNATWAIDDKPLIFENGLKVMLKGEIKSLRVQEGMQASLQVIKDKSALLDIQSALKYDLLDDQIAIKPSTVSLAAEPEFISTFCPEYQTSKVALTAQIDTAKIPFDQSLWNALMELSAKVSLLPLTVDTQGKSVEIGSSDILLAKSKGEDLLVTSDTTAALKGFEEVLGKEINLHTDFPLAFTKDGISIPKSHTKITSERLNFDLDDLSLTNQTVSLKSKARVTYKLNEDSKVFAEIDPFTITLPNDGQIQARLYSEGISLQHKEQDLGIYSFECPISADLKGPRVKGKLHLKGQDLDVQTTMSLGDAVEANAQVNWTISPERFAQLQKLANLAQTEKQKEFKLFKEIRLEADIPSIKIGLTPPYLDGLDLQSYVKIGEVILAPKEGAKLSLAPMTLEARVVGKERKIDFHLASQKGQIDNAASITINGQALNLWDENGIQLDKARVLLDSRIQNLPLNMIQSFSSKPDTAQNAVAVLGDKVNASLKGEIKDLHEGSFRGQIESPRFKSEVSCLLKNGTLLLDGPMTAEYTLTPEAGEVLLKDINPLLVTAARTATPIKLWIDPKNFSIPLKPFSMKEMHMPLIKIEPGILTCKNGGMLSLLVTLLKVDSSSTEEVNLWFTPMHIEVKKGIVHCRRTDALLADAFPIATWGTIDLVKNSVDMTLGISGTALLRAFDIQTVAPEYLVQIPIHGNTQSPKIDTVRATAKITALKMQQNASNTTALLGGLLEVATSVGEKDEAPPQPTTYPFPWQEMIQKQIKTYTKKQKR